MARRDFDPLTFIPPAAVLRRRLLETETLAERFRVLLSVAERIERTGPTPGNAPAAADRDGTGVPA